MVTAGTTDGDGQNGGFKTAVLKTMVDVLVATSRILSSPVLRNVLLPTLLFKLGCLRLSTQPSLVYLSLLKLIFCCFSWTTLPGYTGVLKVALNQ